MLRFSNLKKRLRAVKQIFQFDSFKLSYVVQPKEELKGIIIKELMSSFDTSEIQREQYLHQITDRIADKIFGDETKNNNIQEVEQDMFAQQRWTFTVVAGFASLWEFQIKILAARYGVEVKKPVEDRSKKQRNTKVMVYKDLGVIIDELSKRTNKCLSLKLNEISLLRSALVHANLDQLRVYANNCNHKYKDHHKGNVFVFGFNDPEKKIRNLSDNLTREEKESEDIYSWFMEGMNSRLLEDIWNIFNDNIKQISILTSFKAHSFDGREKIFEKIAFGDNKLSVDDIDEYGQYFEATLSMKKIQASNYFKDLNSCFKRDIL